MDYRRTYWLLFLGIGVLFGVQAVIALAAGASLDLVTGISALAAVVIVGLATFALSNQGAAGGPDRPNLLFLFAVVAFLFLLAGTVLQLLAL